MLSVESLVDCMFRVTCKRHSAKVAMWRIVDFSAILINGYNPEHNSLAWNNRDSIKSGAIEPAHFCLKK